jgi:hypothetical protein
LAAEQILFRYGGRVGRQGATQKGLVSLPKRPLWSERRNVMDTEVRTTSGVFDEFAKFAHETVDYMRERAFELEKNMGKTMGESGKAFMTKFGEGTKLGSYIENNPSKSAFYAFMTGVMFNHMMKDRGFDWSSATSFGTKSGGTAKPKMSAKAKAA